MISPHIVEREDRKTLDLLGFALGRERVSPEAWRAAMAFSELRQPMDNAVCLYREGERWIVSYTERGGWWEIGSFAKCSDAAQCLYAQLVPHPSPYDHRKAWERKTGQTFSMTDD
jgi:hypothetical protein